MKDSRLYELICDVCSNCDRSFEVKGWSAKSNALWVVRNWDIVSVRECYAEEGCIHPMLTKGVEYVKTYAPEMIAGFPVRFEAVYVF